MAQDTGYLDSFEQTLEKGLVKLCSQALLLDGDTVLSPDITEKWSGEYLEDYLSDAVKEFNESPEVAMAWAGYLGMGVANRWDKDWATYSIKPYSDYYGPRGWDDMDDHITDDILALNAEEKNRIQQILRSCSCATLSLMRREGIESGTETAFYILVRVCSVFFELGASIELKRLGYHKVFCSNTTSTGVQ